MSVFWASLVSSPVKSTGTSSTGTYVQNAMGLWPGEAEFKMMQPSTHTEEASQARHEKTVAVRSGSLPTTTNQGCQEMAWDPGPWLGVHDFRAHDSDSHYDSGSGLLSESDLSTVLSGRTVSSVTWIHAKCFV